MIFPDSTLTNVGSTEQVRTTVGRESSISELIRIGFIENRESLYVKLYSSRRYLRARFAIYEKAVPGLALQSLQLPRRLPLQ